MLSAKQFLAANGLETRPDRIKLVRHVDTPRRTLQELIRGDDFDYYQSIQVASAAPFADCDVLLSFLGTSGNRAVFWAAYDVVGVADFDDADYEELATRLPESADDRSKIKYELAERVEFRELRNRLVVSWRSPRNWHQFKDVDLYELRPAHRTLDFPGYENVILTWAEMQQIFGQPDAHKDWRIALSANAGIYRIVDLESGMIYIGSAYGSEGLWGRWRSYAQSGHGGNRRLMSLDPTRFQWSVVRTVSTSLSAAEVIRIESMEKRKHGSRSVGLNAN